MSWQEARAHASQAVVAAEQGYLSPPASGRHCKDDKPRVSRTDLVPQHPVFDSKTMAIDELLRGTDQSMQSSNKKRNISISGAEDRMLTPPLSRDTRMDGGKSDTPTSRSLSDGELDTHYTVIGQQSRMGEPDTVEIFDQVRSNKRLRGPVASGDSDIEDNPFLSEAFSSRPAKVTGMRPRYEEPEESDTTPKALRPTMAALPFAERVRVDNQDASRLMPIRDTPQNPFIAGGPADPGFCGPQATKARSRMMNYPGKERGKITYVFRGQRVTYADPEYDSDDSDEYPAQMNGQRPQRLQPKLLFPPKSTPQAGPSKPRGGLFVAESAARVSAKRKMDAAVGPSYNSSSRLQAMTGHHIDSERDKLARDHSEARQIRGNSRVVPADRSALLAKLEQADWSDDDEEPSHPPSNGPTKRLRHEMDASENEDAEGEDDLEYGQQQQPLMPLFNGYGAFSNGLASRMKRA